MMSTGEEKLRELLVLGMTGDAAAYGLFLRELSPYLRGYFRKRLQQMPDEVEDLVQETILAIHNKRHTYAMDQPLTPWIYAIARYKLADMWRRHAGREALHAPLEDYEEVLAAPDYDTLEARRDVASLLQLLPEKQRLAIHYLKLKGLSVLETAKLTGMSESAVKVGVHRGLKALATKLRGES